MCSCRPMVFQPCCPPPPLPPPRWWVRAWVRVSHPWVRPCSAVYNRGLNHTNSTYCTMQYFYTFRGELTQGASAAPLKGTVSWKSLASYRMLLSIHSGQANSFTFFRFSIKELTFFKLSFVKICLLIYTVVCSAWRAILECIRERQDTAVHTWVISR